MAERAILKCTDCLSDTIWDGPWDGEDWRCGRCGKLHTYPKKKWKRRQRKAIRHLMDYLAMIPFYAIGRLLFELPKDDGTKFFIGFISGAISFALLELFVWNWLDKKFGTKEGY